MLDDYDFIPSLSLGFFGAFYAASAGAIMAFGYGLLRDVPYDKIKKQTLGGGLFMFGLYCAAPTFLRQVWLKPIP
jgi:hypothetical protein